jgi:SAM-dependent methyltransferase
LLGGAKKFDVVVLYAVLEHMLPYERAKLFDVIWSVLRPHGKVVIYETPNRLWPWDDHTTGLLLWSWLPPQWALRYGKWRKRFTHDTDLEHMYRQGYGVAYWELLKWLRGKKCEVHWKYIREPFIIRTLIRMVVHLCSTPRWGFTQYLNLVITKL